MPGATCFYALLCAVAASRANPVDKGPLEPGAALEAAVEFGMDHVWTVATGAGSVYDLRVEQIGTNVEVRWAAGPDSRTVDERQGWSGEETVWWVAESDGTASITVRTKTQRLGRYRISIAMPRPATSDDRSRDEAERALGSKIDLAALRAAADRFGALGLPDRRARALCLLGETADDRGAMALGRKAIDECTADARALSLEERLAECLNVGGTLARRAGDIAGASARHREAVEIREQRGDPGPLAEALRRSSLVPLLNGEYESAEAQLQRAAVLAGEAAEPALSATIEGSRATLAAFKGDIEGALTAYQAAREVIREQGSPEHDVTLAINIGITYGNLGDVDRSIARLREAVTLAESHGLQRHLGFAHRALGGAYLDAGDLDAAGRELRAALALAHELPWLSAAAGGDLGSTLTRQGRFAEAEEQLARLLASAEKSGDRMVLATTHLLLGQARLGARSWEEAEISLRTALAMYGELQASHNEGRAWTTLAQVARARGDLEGAAAHAEKAIAAFASVRARVALTEGRAHLFAHTREAYDVAVEILLERERREPGRGHLARAFALTERARGRSLAEELSARGGAEPGVPPELALQRRRALDRIGHLQRELTRQHTSANPDRAVITRLERDIESAVADEETARRAILTASPRAAARLEPAFLSAADVRARLAPREALLEYHVAADASWLFVLTHKGLSVVTLPGERTLRKDVEALRRHLERPTVLGARAYADTAFRLYSTLIAPSLPRLEGVDRLRIVPDGPLWEIPFETLVTRVPHPARYGELPYVLRRWTVVYQPSASIVALRHEPTAAADGDRPTLVAFAAPILPGARPGGAVVGLERAIFREGERWSLPPLPCAEKEARAAARMFNGRAEVYVGDQARESRLKAADSVRSARYLLFATHAVLSEILPSQSALVLAQVGDGVEDGLLQVHEIVGLDVSAEVVVLSACESALGRNLRGEGLLGLSRAFFHAGARELVASLWKVADCSTAELVTAFFSRLRNGETEGASAEALRAAKLRLAGRAPTAHPYYWGPFVLLSTRDSGPASSRGAP